ncbi:sigma-54 dependent transcriptional regulator [Kiloniella laminariae]|uniref:Sigma-54 dependent transcriptional regulator n=1 Tax=Kiloniella laminariae TaxID=454162 RepID=A0ABT4LNP4_9PROT|nr:sigma-54 dependent transcriptional regulator [Kiloniella laminariae]MCZ4282707.1 sigma-54 dependent transcriptional regulator [Kiloniella laminariae]
MKNNEIETDGPVFLIDDERAIRVSTKQWLELAGHEFVEDFQEARSALEKLDWHYNGIVISDVKMPGMDGLSLLKEIKNIDPDIPVVLVTGHGDVSMAVEAMRNGAYDFIEKPFEPEHLLDIVRRALEKRALVQDNRSLKRDLAAAEGLDARLVGANPIMRALKRDIMDIAPTNASVLIQGETGSGKEVVASCLHEFGPTPSGNFVAVNCAAIPEQMAESEFFGHEKGAFTGAQTRRTGKLEAANGGTLFLDELSSMSMDLQAKLLRALEERKVVPLGGNTPRSVHFRLIAALQEPAEEAIASGRLREDLYYRIATFVMTIPPLRARKDDLPILFRLLAKRASETFGREIEMPGPEGIASLMAHNWPGNVRELRNAAERYALSTRPTAERLSIILNNQEEIQAKTALPLSEQVRLFERNVILASLNRHKGNVTAVMQELSLPRRTLNEKMAKLNLKRTDTQ